MSKTFLQDCPFYLKFILRTILINMTTTIVLKTIGSTVFMVNCLIQFGQPAWGLPFPTDRRLDLDQSLDPRPESGHKTRGWTLDQSPNSNRPMRKLHFIQRFHMTSHIFTLYIIYSNRYSRGLLDLFCIKKKKVRFTLLL